MDKELESQVMKALKLALAVFLFGFSACHYPESSTDQIEKVVDFSDGDEVWFQISPDGSMYLFSSNRAGNENIYIKKKTTGEIIQLTDNPTRDSHPVWSPDGSLIAFTSYRDGIGIWTMDPFDRRTLKRITPDSIVAEWPDWSPDWNSIVFSGTGLGSRDIWTVSLTNGALNQITDHPDNEWIPKWSPNGKKIAFYTTWDGKMTDVFVVDLDGNNLKQLTHNSSEDFGVRWGDGNETVYFLSRRYGGKTDIFSAQISNGEIQRKTQNLGVFIINQIIGDSIFFSFEKQDHHIFKNTILDERIEQVTMGRAKYQNPKISPDGLQILAITDTIGKEDMAVTLDMEGNFLKAVDTGEFFGKSANWMSKPHEIIATISEGGWIDTNNLWYVDLKNESKTKITHVGFVDHAVWCEAPYLVMSARTQGRDNLKLWKVHLGTGEVTLLFDDGSDAVVSDYNRRDKTIAFTTYTASGVKSYTMSLENNNRKRFHIPFESYEGVRWSPDGNKICFKGKQKLDDSHDLFVMDLKTNGIKRLTNDGYSESWPSWSRNQKNVFYSVKKSTIGIYKMNIP
ncbi:PD40 domain-containing protein [Ulvibacterium marinum]|uniref:DUF5050 domain-containing protein n=1 Tax=Ulvibacterium marinum TaxID=2419782 RepID=A0A3B0C9B0_9FLAO|nr:PD40 domain-containing protein [Ulvibacterium marinum]RKN79296.1 hypothetical protein D7Z94_13290 [Ulvibacterium marinum]